MQNGGQLGIAYNNIIFEYLNKKNVKGKKWNVLRGRLFSSVPNLCLYFPFDCFPFVVIFSVPFLTCWMLKKTSGSEKLKYKQTGTVFGALGLSGPKVTKKAFMCRLQSSRSLLYYLKKKSVLMISTSKSRTFCVGYSGCHHAMRWIALDCTWMRIKSGSPLFICSKASSHWVLMWKILPQWSWELLCVVSY